MASRDTRGKGRTSAMQCGFFAPGLPINGGPGGEPKGSPVSAPRVSRYANPSGPPPFGVGGGHQQR
ncbi:MAG: hypothetical protein EKK53_21660 [Burkholderiales bacterium]|nr:MAG: hypothetical protein EKK53_21660 [Burkholderiales bacterium]